MAAVAKSAPKVAKEKKSTKAVKPSAGVRSHPPYFQMIREAILALKERTGSSSVAIAKHMEENHKGELPGNFKKFLSTQLRNSTAKGKLVKVKASFKLSDEAKSEAKKEAKPAKEKKPVTEKPKKVVKKTVTLVKCKALSATAAAKPAKKKAETETKLAKKVVVPKKVKKVVKSPAKAKKPKSIKSPGVKKARVTKA